MNIAGAEIPNVMVERYVRAIRNVRTSPTVSADVARAEMHERIIIAGNTTRHDHAFLGALSDAVYDLTTGDEYHGRNEK